MFGYLFKFFKNPVLNSSSKQKIRIFLKKDLRQYRIEYFNLINHMVSKNWPLGNKSIDVENLKLLKLLKFFLIIYIIRKIFLLIFFIS